MRLPSLQARQQRAARMAPDTLAGRCAAALISPIPRPSPWICAWRLAVVDLVVALGLQSHELLVLHGYETVDLVLAFDGLFELRSCRIDRHSWCVRPCLERVRPCPTTKTAPSPTLPRYREESPFCSSGGSSDVPVCWPRLPSRCTPSTPCRRSGSYLFDQAAAARRCRAPSEGQERDLVTGIRDPQERPEGDQGS